MTAPLRLESKDGIATITLAQPERMNALNFEMLDALVAALQTPGARGYERDSHFMRRHLEVRGCELGGGTSQIQRNIIARFMGMR